MPPDTAPSRVHPPADLQMEGNVLRCRGAWTVDGADSLEGRLDARLAALSWPKAGELVLDGAGIDGLDSAGAWLLRRVRRRLEGAGHPVRLQGFPEARRALLDMVWTAAIESPRPRSSAPGVLERIGRRSVAPIAHLLRFLSFVGEICVLLARILLTRPWSLRWRMLAVEIDRSGLNALPIVGLLSFLMGVVIAYQGVVVLALYGADIYVADLVGLSMARELAPLLAAIIVAGRTGSAYTAQIGTMKVTEEIAAMHTMGIPPMEMLVLPKVLGLMIALPLLSVFADVLGIMGGMIMAKLQMGLGMTPFLARVEEAVSLRSFLLGVGKAPVFAAIIAVVGCYQGFRVHASAESVGRRTTVSVVQAIFLVIVTDALFSMLFSWLDI